MTSTLPVGSVVVTAGQVTTTRAISLLWSSDADGDEDAVGPVIRADGRRLPGRRRRLATGLAALAGTVAAGLRGGGKSP